MLLGINGAGKTSILEAIAYSSILKSIRNDYKDSIIKQGCDTSHIKTSVINNNRPSTIDTTINRYGKDIVSINEIKIKKSSDLLEELIITLFTPEDLNLIKGSPALRRDYLDEIISSISLEYLNCKKQFEKALKQRNILLKQANTKSSSFNTTLNIWDEQFGKYSVKLVKLRKELLDNLQPYIEEEFNKITNINKEITINYISSVKNDIISELKDKRYEDIGRKITTIGAHRDDIEIIFGDLNSRKQLSQGQQRSLAIALLLAKHRFVTDSSGKVPVILLDDALSELDDRASAHLLEQIYEYQSIITSATRPIQKISVTKEVKVDNGKCIYDQSYT